MIRVKLKITTPDKVSRPSFFFNTKAEADAFYEAAKAVPNVRVVCSNECTISETLHGAMAKLMRIAKPVLRADQTAD